MKTSDVDLTTADVHVAATSSAQGVSENSACAEDESESSAFDEGSTVGTSISSPNKLEVFEQ